MKVGILGSGLMGGKLGTLFARAGHDVVFSYARSADKLNRLAMNEVDKTAAKVFGNISGSPRVYCHITDHDQPGNQTMGLSLPNAVMGRAR